uniref:Uncharacterized protein n=1 Tax=viral metagenome TaxID=1070528 RepID=A0A6C0D4J2_9ZZZZ
MLPMEMINEILAFNNRKIVLHKTTNQYHICFLSFDSYQPITDIYKSVKFYGTTHFKSVCNYFVKWYEISYKNKWQMRHLIKMHKPCGDEEEYSGYVYNTKPVTITDTILKLV